MAPKQHPTLRKKARVPTVKKLQKPGKSAKPAKPAKPGKPAKPAVVNREPRCDTPAKRTAKFCSNDSSTKDDLVQPFVGISGHDLVPLGQLSGPMGPASGPLGPDCDPVGPRQACEFAPFCQDYDQAGHCQACVPSGLSMGR